MAKKKAKIDKDGYVTFLNDEDGFSAKDYLLIISTVVFFGFITIGLILILCGIPIDDDYMKLIGMVDAPLMVIVGGIMSINVTEKIVDGRSNKNQQENEYSEEEI